MSYLVAGTLVPDAPPPVEVVPPKWPGIEAMKWYGWDGSEWDLRDVSRGVVFADEDVEGLWFPEIDRHTSRAQGIPGTRWRGWDVSERDVFWPLLVFSRAGSREWLIHNDALMRTFHPERPGIWLVQTALGTRRLRCRFNGGVGRFGRDPSMAGWHVYGVKLVAEDPYWVGDEVTITWESAGGGREFLPGSDSEDGFFLAGPYTSGAATVTNPGDVDAYWRHILRGPIDAGAKVGVSGKVIVFGAPVAAGDMVTIDTRPDRLTITDATGASLFGSVTGAALFPPVPAGRDVPVMIEFSGAGNITSTFEPSYLRAF